MNKQKLQIFYKSVSVWIYEKIMNSNKYCLILKWNKFSPIPKLGCKYLGLFDDALNNTQHSRLIWFGLELLDYSLANNDVCHKT